MSTDVLNLRAVNLTVGSLGAEWSFGQELRLDNRSRRDSVGVGILLVA